MIQQATALRGGAEVSQLRPGTPPDRLGELQLRAHDIWKRHPNAIRRPGSAPMQDHLLHEVGTLRRTSFLLIRALRRMNACDNPDAHLCAVGHAVEMDVRLRDLLHTLLAGGARS